MKPSKPLTPIIINATDIIWSADMGCDIHPVLEKKITKNGYDIWVGIHAFPTLQEGEKFHWYKATERHYRLFAKLAGVRGDGPDPRGLPDDVSDLAYLLLNYDLDYHSHSWVTAREWIAACYELEDDPAKLFLASNSEDPRIKDPMNYYLQYDVYEENDSRDNYRIVFAFDN